jgi:predicted RNA-binding protein with PIN domain
MTSFWTGFARALALIALFPALGLGVRAGLAGGAAPSLYPASGMDELPAADDEPELWLVDGFNVVQVALLGGRDRERWWGSARRAELLERASRLSAAGARIEVVFDGERPAEDREGAGPREVFADSADAWLVARVKSAADPARIAVVTADRRLAGRVRHHGARVVAPSDFLRRCEV